MEDNTYGFSLRQRLLLRLLGPLFLVLMLGAVAMFALARHVGSVVYDRWLYDSAMTLAQQIKIKDNKAVLDLSQTAVEMFEWDSVDRVYEEVTSQKTGLVFSNATFPRIPANLVTGKPRFYDALVSGKPARIVAVRLAGAGKDHDTFTIQVAETKHKRDTLVADILSLAIPLQTFILVLAAAMVWFAVTSSLRILDVIAERLAAYNPAGLFQVADVRYAPHEVRPLLDSINRLIAKLAEAQSTQRRFIANAAHQLRTPLATLQVQTERALREPDRERLGVALSHVLKAITRARHLVHQLLTLARSDQSGEQLLDMVTIDLAALARDELEQWADAAIRQKIDLGYEGPERDVMIQAEPHLLREMIGNLVDNAIRYGHPGGVITLGLSVSPVRLTVCDDGPGIPEDERALVVERFYRRSGAPGDGCGLGLAIAREIAIRHQAKLRITDNPRGRGTQVEVVFAALVRGDGLTD
jgi:two-component system sensor histidine kinase TctE